MSDSQNSTCSSIEECIRNNPGRVILGAIGLGLVVGIAIRALQPREEEVGRIRQILNDLERRIPEVVNPAARRISKLAESGAETVRENACALESRVESGLRSIADRLRSLIH